VRWLLRRLRELQVGELWNGRPTGNLVQGGDVATKKKSAAKKTGRKAAKRELIAPRGDKRYIRRDTKGRIKESDDQGRSVSTDRRRKAKAASKPGHGDRGDRKTQSASKRSTGTSGRKTQSGSKRSAGASRSKTQSASKQSAQASVPNVEAIAQLTADHSRVKQMFKEFERLAKAGAGDSEREDLAARICAELMAHATAEEEIFYPAARNSIDDPDLITEAGIEHTSAKQLIAQIQTLSPSDAKFDATVKVLGEYVDHHVQEEEGEIFPKVRRSELDTVAIGEQLEKRKATFMAKMLTS
jgi:hemerythrin superfamily protein